MSTRKIEYEVAPDGITPSSEQFGGSQQDHNTTTLKFKLKDELWRSIVNDAGVSDRLVYHFIAFDGEGKKWEGETSEFNKSYNNVIPTFPLQKRLTKMGGKIKVYLIITVIHEDETSEELYSFPALLYLKDVPNDYRDDGKYQSMATMEDVAKRSAESAKASADIATEGAERTEAAKAALESGVTFIFDGGDSETEIPIHIVVDAELDTSSPNPIQNKAVAEKFNGVDDEIEELNEKVDEIDVDAIKEAILAQAFLLAHPVGDVWITSSNDDPNVLYPGTNWEKIENKFLFGSSEDYSVGDTGGEFEHTLTVNEMPSHEHTLYGNDVSYLGANWSDTPIQDTAVLGNSTATDFSMIHGGLNMGKLQCGYVKQNEAGNGYSHNNMPPYQVFNFWHRLPDDD